MTLNIMSNFAANKALRNLQINGDEAAKSVGKLSSGSRVVTAADDAGALSVGTRLNTEVKSLEQASVNAGQAVSLLQIADGGLSRIQEMLTRMKVLAVQAGSENLSNSERSLLDTEFQNLKLEIERISRDTRFNGVSLIGGETFVSGANLTAANTSVNAGLAQMNGISDTVGNTNGVLDLTVRGIDNRAATLGGDGQVIITIYQGDVSISTDTGMSAIGVTYVAQTGAVASTIQDMDTTIAGPYLTRTWRTEQTQGTTYNAVAYVGTALQYSTAGFEFQTDSTRARTRYDADTTMVIDAVNSIYGVKVESVTNNNPGTNVVNQGGAAATIGQDLVFTAFFEFGDLDGDGFSDVITKKATVDGSLFVNGSDTGHTNDITLSTGITLAFGNDQADFSRAGGISKESRKNSAISISIDPAAANANLNLGGDAAGVFQGLFAANGVRYAQGTFDAQTDPTGGSGMTDYDFKVGTGIIADEDNINIKIGGVTLEELGLVNAEIRSKSSADSAGEGVSAALDYLVNVRADVGASINRLETAGDNIAIAMENQEAARSRLLDLHVADEVTRFTSNQILLQSGTSVLAQANQLPQNVLRLYG